MATKKYYLDKRTLKTPTADGSLANLQNVLDLESYIASVSVPYVLPQTIAVDTITEDTLNHGVAFPDTVKLDIVTEFLPGNGVTIENVNLQDGGLSNTTGTFYVPFYAAAAQNNITAGTGGAIAVTNYLTTINTDAGGDAFTLANGTQKGQLKKIQLVVDGGGDAVITPATPLVFGYTTITMNDASDFVILQWSGSAWFCIENSGATLA